MFMLVALLVCIGCEKDDNFYPDRLRITKIAGNPEMKNPWCTLEYNSSDQLIKVLSKHSFKEIKYNEKGQPVEVRSYDVAWSTTTPYDVSYIEWFEDGFEVVNPDWEKRRKKYVLDADYKIISEIDLRLDSKTKEFKEVKIIENKWSGNNQLKRVCTYYPPLSEKNENYEVNYKFATGWSPLKGMNIALVVGRVVCWSECCEIQNTYCTSLFSDNRFTAEINYQYNEQNYPTRAEIDYYHKYGLEYAHFAYESY
jgi:hypothetical protein